MADFWQRRRAALLAEIARASVAGDFDAELRGLAALSRIERERYAASMARARGAR